MAKNGSTFHYSTLFKNCQGFWATTGFLMVLAGVLTGFLVGFLAGFLAVPVQAEGLTETQATTIAENCTAIKANLAAVQRSDARTRVYLGRYYETILNGFMTPLNVRLVENSISNAGLLENQANFSARRTDFTNDYIAYQQGLEDLVTVNCRTETAKFYEKLLNVRAARAKVRADVEKLRGLAGEQIKLVEDLEKGL